MTNFIRMIKDESGASAAEYALILAVVGIGIVVAAIALGGAVGDSMNCAADTITAGQSQGTTSC
jgi:pilus assembly protein Flp/PilA